ncbi:uncharacterized protein B0I36DRAFT_407345 [Microdochium trichocladiopsis]|uniref:Uncharacterized protein n=1 Tax=Microdochium trichocladiopsis TaxID=1682393 RepID=A0A9P9BRE5_9PEZI|nr:uncharacterized protein B0I36DRAFT_407345 [Microdochium trichocladiopsis]KAH7032816.1 hypothetical protein B0I36DRAFT_407345 [Microdochium trichocladiopsis]
MPRNPRSYIPPGVGKRVTRAETAKAEQDEVQKTQPAQAPQPAQTNNEPARPAATKSQAPNASKKRPGSRKGPPSATNYDRVFRDSALGDADERSVAETLLALSGGSGGSGHGEASLGTTATAAGTSTLPAAAAAATATDYNTTTYSTTQRVKTERPKNFIRKRKRPDATTDATSSATQSAANPDEAQKHKEGETEERETKRARTLTREGLTATVPETAEPQEAASSWNSDSPERRPLTAKRSSLATKTGKGTARAKTKKSNQPPPPATAAATGQGERQTRNSKKAKALPVAKRPLEADEPSTPAKRAKLAISQIMVHSSDEVVMSDKHGVDTIVDSDDEPLSNELEVISESRQVEADIDVLEDSGTPPYGGQSTDWTETRAGGHENVYFFAYDRLMQESRMLREYPDAIPVGVAKIEGWRFCLAGPRRAGTHGPTNGQISSEGYPTIVSYTQEPRDSAERTMPPPLTPRVYGRVYLVPRETFDYLIHDELSTRHAAASLTLSNTVELLQPINTDRDGNEIPLLHTTQQNPNVDDTHVARDPAFAHLSLPLRTVEILGQVQTVYILGEVYHMPERCACPAAMAAGYDVAETRYDQDAQGSGHSDGASSSSSGKGNSNSDGTDTATTLSAQQQQQNTTATALQDKYKELVTDVHFQTLLLRDHERPLLKPVLGAGETQRWAAKGLCTAPVPSAERMLLDLRPRLLATSRIYASSPSALREARRRLARENERKEVMEMERKRARMERINGKIRAMREKKKGKSKDKGKYPAKGTTTLSDKEKQSAVVGQAAHGTEQRPRPSGSTTATQTGTRSGKEVAQATAMESREPAAAAEEGETGDLQPRLRCIAPLEPRYVPPASFGASVPHPVLGRHGRQHASSSTSSVDDYADDDDAGEAEDEDDSDEERGGDGGSSSSSEIQYRALDRITEEQNSLHERYMADLHDAVVEVKLEGLIPVWYIFEDLRAWVPNPRDVI